MSLFKIIFVLVLITIFSCQDLNNVANDKLIARVNNNYLYESDIIKLNLNFSSVSDSIVNIQNFINKWARNHLLYSQSLINIPLGKRQELDNLVNQYRLDLYNNNYKESIIKAKIDTLISYKQLKEYYDRNNSVFTLKEPLYRFRFIELPKDNVDRKEIAKRFKRFSNFDKKFIDSLSFQFNNSFLNDSIWVTKKTLLQYAPFLVSRDFLLLKKSKYFELEQSIQLYLFKIEDYLPVKEIAPLSYVENTIRNIVFNERKLEFLKNFNQGILNDAIKNKKFEIYP